MLVFIRLFAYCKHPAALRSKNSHVAIEANKR